MKLVMPNQHAASKDRVHSTEPCALSTAVLCVNLRQGRVWEAQTRQQETPRCLASMQYCALNDSCGNDRPLSRSYTLSSHTTPLQ